MPQGSRVQEGMKFGDVEEIISGYGEDLDMREGGNDVIEEGGVRGQVSFYTF